MDTLTADAAALIEELELAVPLRRQRHGRVRRAPVDRVRSEGSARTVAGAAAHAGQLDQ
jgi:hypothetical protein